MSFFPPFGPPGGGGFPPFLPPGPTPPLGPPPGPPGSPMQPGAGLQAPTAPPPQFVPQQPQTAAFAVDPGGIRRCLFRNTYIWLSNGNQFWYFPVFVGRHSVAGFQWNGFFWMYAGYDLRRIESFTCF
ncbi:collagen-like protein [Paenibacillus sp. PL2-23]|uniref:collagen-like protein n=1 Tax=Paenibacillus sp. PL2-23 TaxID=2100729 RepID=UPI0030FB6CDC